MSEQITAAPFAHWMLREILEQPATLGATLAAYVVPSGFRQEACDPLRTWLRRAAGEIVIAASGSSRHAGQIAEILLEDLGGVAVDVEYASEYTYRSTRALKRAPLLVISQSGETVDTLAALRKARQMGDATMAITNVPGSTMAREADVAYNTAAGRERAIPATKSFTAQVLNLYLLSLLSGELHGTLNPEEIRSALVELHAYPQLLESQLSGWSSSVRALAHGFGSVKSFLFVGRGVHYPIAREAALKLKESCYLNAEGYPSGELKHGPNALVSDQTPLVMLATRDRQNAGSVQRYDKVLQLMRDMRQQGARILAVANEDDDVVAGLAADVIRVPESCEALLAISEVIPLQMLAYFIAVNNRIDVDHPRNLSKAVLAE